MEQVRNSACFFFMCLLVFFTRALHKLQQSVSSLFSSSDVSLGSAMLGSSVKFSVSVTFVFSFDAVVFAFPESEMSL